MKSWLLQWQKAIKLLFVYLGDWRFYYRYSMSGTRSSYSKDAKQGRILLLVHALEKDMSFQEKKQNWGEAKCQTLCELIDEYSLQYGKDAVFTLAVSVIQHYRNDPSSSKNENLLRTIDRLLTSSKNNLLPDNECGVRHISEPVEFDTTSITNFFSSRHSVRDFSNSPITDAEIKLAIEIADLTPTACNRQSSKVYTIRNKDIQKQVLGLQLGDQGWCNNANVLFIVTGNQSYFGGEYERQQVYIDGGLFSMNFIWGLHLYHIGSCCKMFVRNRKLQNSLSRLLDIPENEVPIALILAGHYKSEPILGPVSHRFNNSLEFR